MSTHDHSFDNKADWFEKRIYGGMKGRLRLAALWQDLDEAMPALNAGEPLAVWDAGGGLGQITQRCAALGHRVLLNDLSGDMLARAQQLHEAYQTAIEFVQAPIQALAADVSGRFDLVVCHAVLEWVDDVDAILDVLVSALRPGAYLSLAFYNVHSMRLMNALKGNFKKALSEDFSGHLGGLTPPSPRDPHDIAGKVEQRRLAVVLRRGVRVVYDYLPRELRAQRSEPDILALENDLRHRDAFWATGRYVHLIARRED